MSLALEEADPIGFVAVQEYWPQNSDWSEKCLEGHII